MWLMHSTTYRSSEQLHLMVSNSLGTGSSMNTFAVLAALRTYLLTLELNNHHFNDLINFNINDPYRMEYMLIRFYISTYNDMYGETKIKLSYLIHSFCAMCFLFTRRKGTLYYFTTNFHYNFLWTASKCLTWYFKRFWRNVFIFSLINTLLILCVYCLLDQNIVVRIMQCQCFFVILIITKIFI